LNISREHVSDGNNSLLTAKYTELSKLCIEMMDIKYGRRPDCEQILQKRHLWALSSEEFDARQELRKVLRLNYNTDPFVYSIINLKLSQ